MPKCIDCGEQYETKPGGDIMLAVCYTCRAKPRPPDPYVKVGGIFMPNPEATQDKGR